MISRNMADLGIVIPYFNQPEQLRHVLADIADQRGLTIQVVVVDDASDLDCGAVIEESRKNGLDASLVLQPERAYTLAARLRGMREINARWLTFMDSDDGLCAPLGYAKAVNEADDASTDILHFRTLAPNRDGVPVAWQNALPFTDKPLEGEEIFSTWLAKNCPAHSVWNKLYSRELYRRLLEQQHEIPIFRIEDFYLTSCFLTLARKYVSSHTDVYLYHPPLASPHLEKCAARAIDAMHMYFQLPAALEKMGLDPRTKPQLTTYLRKLVTANAGRMCRILEKTFEKADFAPDAKTMRDLLKYGTKKDYILTLAILNASNARKLKKICSGNVLSQNHIKA